MRGFAQQSAAQKKANAEHWGHINLNVVKRAEQRKALACTESWWIGLDPETFYAKAAEEYRTRMAGSKGEALVTDVQLREKRDYFGEKVRHVGA